MSLSNRTMTFRVLMSSGFALAVGVTAEDANPGGWGEAPAQWEEKQEEK